MTRCILPKITQGDFHTHPFLSEGRKEVTTRFPERKFSDEEVREFVSRIFRDNKQSPNSPSDRDLRLAIKEKFQGKTGGTACIGGDIEIDNVECWTAIDDIKQEDFIKVLTEPEQKDGFPKEWLKRLFDREIIGLKK